MMFNFGASSFTRMSIALSEPQDIFATLSQRGNERTGKFISQLWPCQAPGFFSKDSVNAIASYWRKELCFERKEQHSISSFDDLKALATIINDNPGLEKLQLIQAVRLQLPNLKDDDSTLMNSIELAARLFLMIKIPPVRAHSVDNPVPWPGDMSLATVLKSWFPHTPPPQTSKKYGRILNVYNLERMGGFKIQPTDNLVQHLMFEENVIYLFCHVSVLRHMRECVSPDLLSFSFFDETLETLSLLFPRSDTNCARWLREQQKNHFIDSALSDLELAKRNISCYSFWRERLDILEEEFTESEPRTLFQWWFDRRKRVQWYTFWVAILVLALTIFLGAAQTATGVIQAWASIQSMKSANQAKS